MRDSDEDIFSAIDQARNHDQAGDGALWAKVSDLAVDNPEELLLRLEELETHGRVQTGVRDGVSAVRLLAAADTDRGMPPERGGDWE